MPEQSKDFLSAEQLQLFVAGLSGLPREEVRKAKSLYLRNAISEMRAARASIQGFQVAQGCFAVIPFFWPILWAQRSAMTSGMRLYEERVRNALAVWRDDLGPEAGELERMLDDLVRG